MCQALIDIKEEGYDLGLSDGIDRTRVEAILNAKESFHISLDEAMKGLKIPEKDWDRYREMAERAEAEQKNDA